MSTYKFVSNLSKEKFNSLTKDPNVKTHFLGSWEWGQVSLKNNWIPHYVGVERDGKLVATALLLQKKLFLGLSYFYIPRGFTMDYSDLDLLSYITKKINNYCKEHGSVFFKIDPDIKLHNININGEVVGEENNYSLMNTLKVLGYTHMGFNYYFENEQPRFTFRIPLEGTLEEISDRYSRTTKNCIKNAFKSGVKVTIGDEKDINEFVRLMNMTEKRQDFYSHENDYYSHFYNILKQSDMVDLYLGIINIPELTKTLSKEYKDLKRELDKYEKSNSKKARNKCKDLLERIKPLQIELEKLNSLKKEEDIVVSAYMNVRYVDKSWTLYAGNDMEYRRFYANYLVYQKQIEDAVHRKLKVFDGFGTIGKKDLTNNLNGLFEFKKKWGGEYIEFIGEFDYIQNKPLYFLYKKLIPIYRRVKNKFLRKKS